MKRHRSSWLRRWVKRLWDWLSGLFSRQLPPVPSNREVSAPPEIMAAGTYRPQGKGPGTFRVPPRRVPPALQEIFVYAEMDESVIVNRVTTLEVVVSGRKIEINLGVSSQSGKIRISRNNPLIVQAIAKTNFAFVGDERYNIVPPSEEETQRLYFDLRSTELGEGEVWVVFYESQMPLLTLSIKSNIVANRADAKSAMISSLMPEKPSSAKVRVKGDISTYPSGSDSIHQLRIIEKRDGSRITYRYELDSPSLGILKSFESQTITSDRKKYVANLYKEIESRWVSNSDDAESFNQELRAFGGSLFDELFPSELRALLWKHRKQIDSIMVLSTEPFIPWELIHLKEPEETCLPAETLFLAQMGLVRWLYGSGRFPSRQISVCKGEAAYVIPHYPDPRYRLPQAEKESEFLQATFNAYEIEPTSAKVRSALTDPSFGLLHFAGHGVADQENIGDSKLMMKGRVEGKEYIPDFLSATTVGQFSNMWTKRPMVVLNACQIGREGYTLTGIGGFAEAFLRSGAGAFIGPLWSVGDRPAKLFTETLYKELIEGQKLSQATNSAREAARQAGNSTWLAYTVYGHPNMTFYLPRETVIPE